MENNNNNNNNNNGDGGNGNNYKKRLKMIFIVNIIILMFVGFYAKNYVNTEGTKTEEIAYSKVLKIIKDNNGKKMELSEREDGIVMLKVAKDDKTYVSEIPKDNEIGKYVEKYEIDYSRVEMPKSFAESLSSIFWILIIIGGAVLMITMFKGQKDQIDKATKMTKNANENDIPKVEMDQIGGLSPETKEEINSMIETFKNADSAAKYGIRPIKGAILYGPPGTGKTLLAKGIANGLQAKFYSLSGSSFTEMFVGVGASRVRNLFDEARKNKPSLIFIDEIDAIAGKRHPAAGANEKESTLNELLVQLDGVNDNKDVMVLVATNRLDMLDEAFVRAGRFDYKIKIDLPDLEGRKEIIKIHTTKKPLSNEVLANLDDIAKNTYGYSGAELEGLFLTAATNAFRNKKEKIDMDDINYAIDRNILGTKGRKLEKQKLKERVAYHEAGHALLAVLNREGSVRKATIAPRGGALGFVAQIPDEMNLDTYSELIGRVQMILAGGVAEMKKFKEHSLGVGGDVQQAKQLIERMVDAGMGDGDFKLSFEEKDKKEKMQKIYDDALKGCKEVLSKYEKEHEALTMALLEKETLDGDEVEHIVLGKELKPKVVEEVSEEKEVETEETTESDVGTKESILDKKISLKKETSEI